MHETSKEARGMIGFIGGGNMAEALIRGIAKKPMGGVMVSEPRPERRGYLESTLGVRTTGDNAEVIRESKIILFAVKPQDLGGVLEEVTPLVTDEKTFVSIAAGVTIGFLRDRLKTSRIIRVMPNVASMVGEGMAAISLCECFSDPDVNVVKEIFMSSGRVLMLPEKQMDAVTALSGSGPAFVANFLGLMVEAATGLGLREQDALELGLQTLKGTSALLESGIPPTRLIDMVRSPGGTTEAGLGVFDGAGMGETVHKALEAAAKRAKELSR